MSSLSLFIFSLTHRRPKEKKECCTDPNDSFLWQKHEWYMLQFTLSNILYYNCDVRFWKKKKLFFLISFPSIFYAPLALTPHTCACRVEVSKPICTHDSRWTLCASAWWAQTKPYKPLLAFFVRDCNLDVGIPNWRILDRIAPLSHNFHCVNKPAWCAFVCICL